MRDILEHPEITHAQRTGYPSWVRDFDCDDEDDLYNDDDEEDYYE